MAENPRDYIRAAQTAEHRGDKAGAADLLHRAAAVYARSGKLSRALQLLRNARRMDDSREDIAAALKQLESQAEALSHATFEQSGEQSGEQEGEVTALPVSNEELAEQQRLIQEALRALEATADAKGDKASEKHWVVEEPAPEELARLTQEVASDDARREGRAHLFERGPAKADPTLDAWCSFCCRPRTEVGELVAGPAGAFICRACVGESEGLLAGVGPVPRPVAASEPAPKPAREVAPALVGQEEARALLAHALEAGLRRLLVLGPEGVGKTTWLRALQHEGQGALVTVDALQEAPATGLLLVEDVDRLAPEAHATLAAFLARQPGRTVLLSARGTPGAPAVVLRGGQARLPVYTTASLADAVGGVLPVALLEQVQLAIALRAPTKAELVEVARRGLGPRASEGCVPQQVLEALAAEALRSPRAGHELRALLSRLPASGTWATEAARVKARAKTKRRPAPRGGRRKGRR